MGEINLFTCWATTGRKDSFLVSFEGTSAGFGEYMEEIGATEWELIRSPDWAVKGDAYPILSVRLSGYVGLNVSQQS